MLRAKIINLTPHDIVIVCGDKKVVLERATGEIPRCSVNRREVEKVEINGLEIPITQVEFGEVENLPEPKDNVFYIVSRAIAEALPNRTDLLIPDDTIRDEQGRIVGCKSLCRVSKSRCYRCKHKCVKKSKPSYKVILAYKKDLFEQKLNECADMELVHIDYSENSGATSFMAILKSEGDKDE